ncbi:MAG: hypothetical protein RI920_1483 [Pseudomonadota bacterium]
MATRPLCSALPRHRAALALAVALSSTLALVGCGSGGDDPAPAATLPVQPSGSASPANYLPMATNQVGTPGSFASQTLLIVDPVTGQPVWQRTLTSNQRKLAVRAFAVSADGLTVTQGKYAAWFYIDQGKLMAVDMRPAQPTEHVVSTEMAVCDILRAEPTDTTAATSVLLFRTAGADGSCETTGDNLVRLASSDTGPGAASLAWAGGNSDALAAHRDVAGKLTQLLAHDSALQQLLVVSPADGRATLVGNGQLAAGTSVSVIGRAAGRRDQAYVVVQSSALGELRTLSWADDNAAPTLAGSSLVAMKSAHPVFAHTDDANGFYFVDDGKVYAIAKGSSTVTTLDSFTRLNVADGSTQAAPFFAGGAMTAHALVLPSLSQTGAVVYVIDKALTSAQRRRTLDLSNLGETPYGVEAHLGDQITVSRALNVGGVQRQLWRADLSGSAALIPTTVVGNKVQVIASPRSDVESLGGEAEQAATVWCDDTVACTAATVQSLQLASGSNLALARAGAADFTWFDHSADTALGSLAAATVSSQLATGVWTSDTAWLLDAGQAGSLRQVTLP